MIEVIKTNPSNIPVGTIFKLNPATGMYESMECYVDVGDNYEFYKKSHYSFSPSFYAFNEEIFNQVKLEKAHEKLQSDAGEESPKTQDESKDVHPEGEADDRDIGEPTADMYEGDQREEMETSSEESKSEREGVHESGSEEGIEASRKEDNRIVRFAELEKQIIKWDEQFCKIHKAFDKFFSVLWSDVHDLKIRTL